MDPPLKLKRNELGLRFLYKLKINTSYIEIINTLDDSEDQNYEENERTLKPMGVYLRRLVRRYMEEQKEHSAKKIAILIQMQFLNLFYLFIIGRDQAYRKLIAFQANG